jgi:hypothetical protein
MPAASTALVVRTMAIEPAALDVGPKFLQNLRSGIRPQRCRPVLKIASYIAIIWIVRKSNTGRHRIAREFRKIQTAMTRIRLRDKDSRQRIPSARRGRSLRHTEIAGVFPEQNGKDAFRQHIACDLIRVTRAQARKVALGTLPELGVIIAQLVEPGVSGRKKKERIIKGVLGRDVQLLPAR